MQYFTVEGKNYDEAVKKASDLYGSRMRIHSRKDITRSGFLGSSRVVGCEISCYLIEPDPVPQSKVAAEQVKDDKPEESEAVSEPAFIKPVTVQSPEKVEPADVRPQVLIEAMAETSASGNKVDASSGQIDLFPSDGKVSQELLDFAEELLELNDFSPSYCQWIREELVKQLEKAYPDVPTRENIEVSIADKIAWSINIDQKSQAALSPCTVLVGAQGCGKTTTAAKLASIYAARKDSCLISCDESPSAWDQAQKLSNALKVPVCKGYDPAMLSEAAAVCKSKEVTLVDCKGISLSNNSTCPDISSLDKLKPKVWIVVSAATKNSDLDRIFSVCGPLAVKGAVITKMDETSTVGNVISICHDRKIPLVFLSDGRRIPRDFSKATVFALLTRLRGFSVDFSSWARKE